MGGLSDLLISQLQQTTWVEWLVLVLGVSEVLLAKANNKLLYPAGIGASSLSLVLLYKAGLYAESLLNLYYVAMSIYGWILWSRHNQKPPIQISYSQPKDWWVAGAIVVFGWGFLYYILTNFTSSDVAGWDAIVSSFAWAGTWLLSKRKIENWVLLNISNIIAVPLLFHKQLPMFALLTIFLFVVAVLGFFNWKTIHKAESLRLNA